MLEVFGSQRAGDGVSRLDRGLNFRIHNGAGSVGDGCIGAQMMQRLSHNYLRIESGRMIGRTSGRIGVIDCSILRIHLDFLADAIRIRVSRHDVWGQEQE